MMSNLIYLLLLLVGTGGIVFGYHQMRKSKFKRNQAKKDQEVAYLDLEKKFHDRTADLNKANETLLKEQQFLAAVFDSIEVGIVSCDAKGVLTRFNRATRQIHGLPEEPIPADQWAQHYDLFLPDGKTSMQKEDVPLFRTLQGEQVHNSEMMIIPKHGYARTLVASGQTMKDPEGKIIGAVVVMHDITERKRAEEKMHRNEEILRLFVEYSPAAIAMLDHEMKYIVASSRYLIDYGLGDQNIIGRSHYELFPEIPDRWREIHRRCLAGAVEKSEEDPFPRADGRMDWVRWEIHPWHETQGEIGGIILFSEVITERKLVEEELRESEARMRSVFEQANDGIYVISAENRYLDVNERGLELLGYTHEELLHMSVADVLSPYEVARLAIEPPRMMSGVPHLAEWEHMRKDGSTFPGEVSARRLNDFSYLAIVRNLTERRRAENELQKYRDHLEDLVKERTVELEKTQEALVNIVEDMNEKSRELAQANVRIRELDRLKSAFLATMSHELRTPLNSIIGFTGIILHGMSGPLNGEQAKQLGMVKNSANHLLALINDVLDISKIEAGQVEIIMQSFDMRSVIESALRTMMPLAANKALSLESVIASDVGVIISDRRRVEQILINLVNNAVKFTERGDVRIECRINNGRMETCVRDTGIGIKQEDMGKLFIPFSQIETGIARNHEGTGLGLSICLKLAEMMGGTMRVESEWGKGSAFIFTLPLS